MNIFEISGHAQVLLGEGNRQLALAVAAGARRLTRWLAALRHVPGERLHPF